MPPRSVRDDVGHPFGFRILRIAYRNADEQVCSSRIPEWPDNAGHGLKPAVHALDQSHLD